MEKRSFLKKLLIMGVFMLGLITTAQANPINLALSGVATQSSTYPPWPKDHSAVIAIDGITDGDAWQGQITHTWDEFKPWWQVDLLDMYTLSEIVIWNRTDGASERLSNFNVSVLDNSYKTVWANNFFTSGGYPNPSLIIDLPDNIVGQIVKVSLNEYDYLSLAEVQVFAAPEPGTMLLLSSGLLGLAGYGRKKFFKK